MPPPVSDPYQHLSDGCRSEVGGDACEILQVA
jgi:hypothetical protein